MNRIAPLLLAAGLAQGAVAQDIRSAAYGTPTDSYGHGAVAQGEWATILFGFDDLSSESHAIAPWVFEDTQPRLVDLDGDGASEVVTVVSLTGQGAAIWVWAMTADGPQVVARTAPIGQHHRWLAIAGIGDLDGDGRFEIAYVDRPHLARILRVVAVNVEAGQWSLVAVAEAPGHTNHHFGSPVIEGGLRDCGVPEIVTADAGWSRILATRLEQGQLVGRDLGPYSGEGSMAAALACG